MLNHVERWVARKDKVTLSAKVFWKGTIALGWGAFFFCCISAGLFGCAAMVGNLIGQSALKVRDEAAATRAVEKLQSKYPYIEFNQEFPETYLFEEKRSEVWKTTLSLLGGRKEKILSKDKKKGEIITDAKELASSEDQKGGLPGAKRVFYEQHILIKAKGPKKTYVTNNVIFFKSDKYGINRSPISLSDPGNVIRGVFFGTLACTFYPGAVTGGDEVVHVVKSGESLGAIAKQYTGSEHNFKKIANYNGIEDPSAVRVGQKIRIPKYLQQHN